MSNFLSSGAALGNLLSIMALKDSQEEREDKKRRQFVQDTSADTLLRNMGAVGSPEYKQRTFTPNPEDAAEGVQPITFGQNQAAQNLLSMPEQEGLMAKAIGPQNYLSMKMAQVAKQNEPYDLAPGAIRMQGGRIIASNPKVPDLPAAIQEALFQANGDPTKARSIMAQKGQDGEWAIVGSTGKAAYIPKTILMNAKPGDYLKVPTGMKITTDGQGGFEMVTGDMANGDGLQKPTIAKLEDTIIQGQDALARMRQIQAQSKPEYQQLGTRWGNLMAAGKEKFGVTLSPQDQSNLNDFTTYRRNVVANTNQTIKDLTGATVGKDEAPRLLQQMPVAGQGLLDGDSPTEFDAKLKGTMDSIAASVARANYARSNGLTKQQQFAIPLDSVPKMVEDKGNQYKAQIKQQNPNIPDAQITEMVKARLRTEFGL